MFSFRLHAYAPFRESDGAFIMEGKSCMVAIKPENWRPARVSSREHGIDYHESPVFTLALDTEPVTAAKLQTILRVRAK